MVIIMEPVVRLQSISFSWSAISYWPSCISPLFIACACLPFFSLKGGGV